MKVSRETEEPVDVRKQAESIIPDGTKVLVKPAPKASKVGEIHLADTAQAHEPAIMATVISVGPGKRDLGEDVPMRYRPKQLVIISAQSGHPLLLDGVKADGSRVQVEFRFIEQDSILGHVNL